MSADFQRPNHAGQLFKFGHLATNQEEPYFYSNTWALQKTSGPERLIIAPSIKHVSIMTKLLRGSPEPFAILYVLMVPRAGGVAGRYQASTPKTREETETFLFRFAEFFEGDARHHIWVASMSSSDFFVYDHHNVIYAYGDLGNYTCVLQSNGLSESESVNFPAPHVHKYNAIYDPQQLEVMGYWEWTRSELREGDDY